MQLSAAFGRQHVQRSLSSRFAHIYRRCSGFTGSVWTHRVHMPVTHASAGRHVHHVRAIAERATILSSASSRCGCHLLQRRTRVLSCAL